MLSGSDKEFVATLVANSIAEALGKLTLASPSQRKHVEKKADVLYRKTGTKVKREVSEEKKKESADRAKADFEAAGFSNCVPHETIKTFWGWKGVGRFVRKGEHSIRGLFHVSQTDAVEEKKAA